jgi:4-amino-4-deoxy-L-arabinose transferase-like glycosyltransferase
VRRVPKPLALLLAVVTVFGVMWVLLVPPWGAPDEDAHFAYTASVADLGRLPGGEGHKVSREQRNSMDYMNTDAVTFWPYAKPEWSPLAEEQWRISNEMAARDDGGGDNAAAEYPPAYYLYGAVAYKATGKADVLTRMYAMRLLSLLWLLVTTTAAWLLAGEVFGKRRPLQLVTAAVVGLWPMLTFISTAVNPDGMLVALWALSTWLGASLVLRGFERKRAVALALCVGVAAVTKATALALIPAALAALVLAAWPLRPRISLQRAVTVGAVALAFLLPVGGWYVVANAAGKSAYGQTSLVAGDGESATTEEEQTTNARPPSSPSLFASYLWQYYLPRLGFMEDQRNIFPAISGYPAFQVWLASGWASFGWVNVWFPKWVYWLFLAVALVIAAGVAVRLGRWLRGSRAALSLRRPRVRLGVFFALMAGLLWAGLHWTDYQLFTDGKSPFMQGRYLLPLAPLLALLVAQATRALPQRFRGAGQGAVLGGLVVFQVACLGLIASRYYFA